MTPIRLVAALLVLAALPVKQAAAQPSRTAIVLPVELAGYWPKRNEWRREFTLALEDRLRTARFVVKPESFATAETDCRDAMCLASIGMVHGVDVAVAGRAINDEQRLTSYHLRALVFERGANPPTRQREKVCANCTETQAREMLATLVSAALANEPEPTTPPDVPVAHTENPPSTNPVVSPAPVDLQQAERERRRRWVYRGTGLGLGVMGLLGLAQGFAEVAHNGDIVVRDNIRYRRDTTEGQGVFLGLGSACLVTGAVLSAIGWWPAKKNEHGGSVALVPDVSVNGGRILVSGTF